MADLRLSDLLVPLSQVTDLGMGQPPGTAARCSVVATRLARLTNVPDDVVRDVFFTTVLQHLGCTAYAHETARVFGGDDIAVRGGGAMVDTTNPREALPLILRLTDDVSFPARVKSVATVLRLGSSFDMALSRANCEVAVRLADRLGLDPGVQRGLDHIYERWDGNGHPRHEVGDAIPLPARIAHVASQAVLLYDAGGVDVVQDVIRRRQGNWLDPSLAELFLMHRAELLADLQSMDVDQVVRETEPAPVRLWMRTDAIARAFADMVDVKFPFAHGHSSGVARIAEDAALRMGLSQSEVTAVRLAGFLHDIGHVGTPNGILEKRGPLTTLEWERVRLHPYHAERILARSGALAPLADLAGMHHERMNGSGYPHHATGQAIPMGARIIAAANVYQAMCEERPYRPAHQPEVAAAQIRLDAEEGRLDADAVEAVLQVTGRDDTGVRRERPAGLTEREVEVLRLAARGLTTREIGERLSIAPKTAGHHIQHIYDKIGVSTRAGAAIFAMEHELIRAVSLDE